MGVENPQYYKTHPSGVECIEVIYGLYYGQGNAIKYLWRLGMKDTDLQELEKAMWYTIHCDDAGFGKSIPIEHDPTSHMAYMAWFTVEPPGYRRLAIASLWHGNFDTALRVIKDWYAKIKGIDPEDVVLPTVPKVGMRRDIDADDYLGVDHE